MDSIEYDNQTLSSSSNGKYEEVMAILQSTLAVTHSHVMDSEITLPKNPNGAVLQKVKLQLSRDILPGLLIRLSGNISPAQPRSMMSHGLSVDLEHHVKS